MTGVLLKTCIAIASKEQEMDYESVRRGYWGPWVVIHTETRSFLPFITVARGCHNQNSRLFEAPVACFSLCQQRNGWFFHPYARA
jgi:hypothetical protein